MTDKKEASLPIWQPSDPSSRLADFNHWLQTELGVKFKNYTDLHRFSCESYPIFWEKLAAYFKVDFKTPYQHVYKPGASFENGTWFSGAQLSYAEHLLRQQEGIAIIQHNEQGRRRTLTFSELRCEVAKCQRALTTMGIGPHDRVASFLPNCIEAIILFLATNSIGAIFSSCSPDFGPAAVLDRFQQIEPKVFVTANGYWYNNKKLRLDDKLLAITQGIPSIKETIVIDYLQDDSVPRTIPSKKWHEWLIDGNPNPSFKATDFNHPLYILFSSGTTGKPKCIVHRAGGVLLQHLKELALHTNVKTQDRLFYFTTLGWMMWNWQISALALGATVVIYDGSPFSPSAETLWRIASQDGITHFGTSAKYLASLEQSNMNFRSFQFPKLKTILSTGSPLMPEQYDFIQAHLSKAIQISSISGGTDIVSCFLLGNPMLPVYKGELQCAGLGMDVKVFNEQGEAMTCEKGELVCTSPFPTMPIGFWQDENDTLYHQAYFSHFKDVWAHGDFAEFTSHGGFIIYGRSDSVLNPGGVRIGTAEIYRQVEKVPGVLESIAIGKNEHGEQSIWLYVTLAEGLTLSAEIIENIKQTLRQNASPRHVPQLIKQVSEIPKTKNGKLAEAAVRKKVHGETIDNLNALANPDALNEFEPYS